MLATILQKNEDLAVYAIRIMELEKALKEFMLSCNRMPHTKQIEDAMCDSGMLSAHAKARDILKVQQ